MKKNKYLFVVAMLLFAVKGYSQVQHDTIMQRVNGCYEDVSRLIGCNPGVIGGSNNVGMSMLGQSPLYTTWRIEGINMPAACHSAHNYGVGVGTNPLLHSTMLGNINVETGTLNAEYGDAIGGVIDLGIRNGRTDGHHGAFYISLLGAEAVVEGPLNNSGASYIIGGSFKSINFSSHLGLVDLDGDRFNLSDMAFKLNFPTKRAGTFSVWASGMSDKAWVDDDVYNEEDSKTWETLYEWANYTVTDGAIMGGVNHTINLPKQWKLESKLGVSWDNYSISEEYCITPVKSFESLSTTDNLKMGPFRPYAIQRHRNLQYTAKMKAVKKFSDNYSLALGASYMHNRYKEKDKTALVSVMADYDMIDLNDTILNAGLVRAYADNLFTWDKFDLRLGLGLAHYSILDEWSVEPRVSAKWKINKRTNLGLAYSLQTKTENFGVYAISSDFFIQNNLGLKLPKAHQLKLDFYHQFDNDISFTASAWYQWLVNMGRNPDYDYYEVNRWIYDDFNLLNSDGRQRIYGAYASVNKKFSEDYYAGANVTLYSEKCKALNGEWFHSMFDRGYNVSVYAGKDWYPGNKGKHKISLSGSLNYMGGLRVNALDYETSKISSTLGYPRMIYDTYSYPQSLEPVTDLSITARWRINPKGKISHEIGIDWINVFESEDYFCDSYNYVYGNVVRVCDFISIPNISYSIHF